MWLKTLSLLGVALAVSVAAVGLTSVTSHVGFGDRALRRWSVGVALRHAAALSTSASALPVAAAWDNGLNAALAMLPVPDGDPRGLAAKAAVVTAAVSLMQLRANAARSPAAAAPGGNGAAAARAKRLRGFTDSTLVFLVAWAWWAVPNAVMAHAGPMSWSAFWVASQARRDCFSDARLPPSCSGSVPFSVRPLRRGRNGRDGPFVRRIAQAGRSR